MTDTPDERRAALLRAQALLDDELDAVHAAALESEIAVDPQLQRAAESGLAIRQSVRRHVAPETATPEFRQRILALAASAPAPVKRRPPPRWWQPAALAASFAIAGFLVGHLATAPQNGAPEAEVTRSLVDAYARAAISGQAYDIASSDRHTVKPWLAARTTLGAEVVDLAEAGYPLAGGRLDIVNGAPVATLVYRHHEHWIDVTELPAREGLSTAADAIATVNGYHMRRWNDGLRNYVAISDIDEAELAQFIAAFRKQVEGAKASREP